MAVRKGELAGGAEMRGSIRTDGGRFFIIGLGSMVLLLLPVVGAAQKIKMENGIPVVYNPKKPVKKAGLPSQLFLRRDLLIGEAAGDENYVFSELGSVQADNEGNIYALDSKEVKLRVFDQTGKFLRSFLRKGQGPKEVQLPARMIMTPAERLCIYDLANRRLAFYSKAGECLKEINAAKWSFIRMRHDSRGTIYADSLVMDIKSLVLKLMKFDPELNLISTISEFARERRPGKVDVMPDRFVFEVAKGDRFLWGITSKYEIHVLDPGGKLVRKIVKDFDPVKVTDKDKQERLKDRPSVPITVEYIFPEHFAPIYATIIDNRGWLYVRTNERDEKGNCVYDIFDEDGILFSRFAHPESEILFQIRKNKMYFMISENEEGIPQIKRYAAEWK